MYYLVVMLQNVHNACQMIAFSKTKYKCIVFLDIPINTKLNRNNETERWIR